MIKIFAVIAIIAGAWAAGAWFLMITIGVVHADWLHVVPPIGYRAAFLLIMLTMLHVGIRGALARLVAQVMTR